MYVLIVGSHGVLKITIQSMRVGNILAKIKMASSLTYSPVTIIEVGVGTSKTILILISGLPIKIRISRHE